MLLLANSKTIVLTIKYLSRGSVLQVWISFSNKVKIFFIESGFFFVAFSPALALLTTSSCTIILVFIFIYDETFAYLRSSALATASSLLF
jgi:hypothetical protein